MNMNNMMLDSTEMIAQKEHAGTTIDIMKLSVEVAKKMEMDTKVVHGVIAAILEALEYEAFWREIRKVKQDGSTTANEYESETTDEIHEDGFQLGYRAGWNDAMAEAGNDDLGSIDYDDRCYDDRRDAEDYEE